MANEAEMTVGKVCTSLDIGTSEDRATFERLISEADILERVAVTCNRDN